MKLISQQTIKVEGKYVSPGTEFDIDDKAGKALVETGAASRKMREVVDEEENTDGRPQAATVSPDPAKIGQPNRR